MLPHSPGVRRGKLADRTVGVERGYSRARNQLLLSTGMQEVSPRCWMSTILLFDRLLEATFSVVQEEAHNGVDVPVCYPPVLGQTEYLPIGTLTPTYLVI